MAVWTPVLGHVCVSVGGEVHAVEATTFLPKRRGKRVTFPTVCGRKRARPVAHAAVSQSGEDLGVCMAPWPPPARHARCRDCWTATGKPRPHPSWKTVREAP